jgi:hypothetical protein
MAESVGFEPTVTRRPQRLSRPPHSSALATLRRRHYRWPRAPGETDAATRDQRRTAKKERGALVGAHVERQRELVVEARVAADAVERAAPPGLEVASADDDARDAGAHQRAGAHRAGLERDDERGVGEAPPPERRCGVAQREHLCVRGGVLVQLALVVPGRHHVVADHDQRTHGDVAVISRATGLREGQGHQLVVGPGHLAGDPTAGRGRARLEGGPGGGGSGIRTHGGLPHTRFPSVPIRPLSHPSRGSPGAVDLTLAGRGVRRRGYRVARPALACGGRALCNRSP